MPLQNGTFLGSYEIQASIGAGGMGEVYRARDAKLGRDVAIKILPQDFAQDPERLVRFEREAHLLASLNHPNIGAIYDLSESNGAKFFVLELVPGDTLADLIARGPVPVEEALALCRQIAEALEAAHDKGIVHRDLKPANIKITPDGKVKVLDFGLGKLSERDSAAATLSQSPTLMTARASIEGVILGTAAYMSPEQTRGREIDRRSDIWSFGCVAFEMLTGKQTFEGETVSDLFAAILRSEPAWSALPATVPESVRLLLKRCLQKDVRRRLQHIGEARIAMDDAAASDVVAKPMVTVANAVPQPRRTPWIISAVTLLLISIGLTTALFFVTSRHPGIQAVQFEVLPPVGGAFEQSASVIFTVPTISPDGRWLAFTARDASGKVLLWVRPLDSLTSKSFLGTEGAAFPFWSPDSRSIAFYTQQKLKKVDLAGGPPQAITDTLNFRRGTWNQENVIVFAGGNRATLYAVAASGQAKPLEVTKLLPGQVAHRSPWFLPDGRHFLFHAQGAGETSGLFVGSLDSTVTKRLGPSDSGAVYSQAGHILFVREGTLLRQGFDLKKLEIIGEATPVAEHVPINGDVGAFSVSDTGVLAYRPAATVEQVVLTWMDRSGKVIGTVGSPAEYRGVDLSPDGKRLAVHRHEGEGGDIWIFEVSRGLMSRFTFDPTRENSSPVWSSDSSHLIYNSGQNGRWRIYQKLATGTGNEEQLLETDLNMAPMSWSPDGTRVLMRVVDPNTQGNQSVFSFNDKKITNFINQPGNELWGQISPDGNWVAYASNETGRYEIYVKSFPSGTAQYQISGDGGWFPRWKRDGKELFFLTPNARSEMESVKINSSASSFQFDRPVKLFDSGFINFTHPTGGTFLPWAVSADGQQFLIPRPDHPESASTGAIPIIVVVNWAATLNK
jgi:serine/threonine protein kinase/Tol biopolymer transport system component